MYLTVENICKSFDSGQRLQVLRGVSTGLEKGQMYVIYGPSGSGKSTLLNAIGALEPVDSGTITMDGQVITGKNPRQLARFRRETLGFVFQFYNLVPNLTVHENIQVCRYLSPSPLDMERLLETLGLAEHRHKFPHQLSGGQQQRCAIARALVKNPKLLLCDEPTGALDSVASREILMLLEDINCRYGTTVLMVTHNAAIKAMVHKVIQLRDGQITHEVINETRLPAAQLAW